jgi:hypothetical protein
MHVSDNLPNSCNTSSHTRADIHYQFIIQFIQIENLQKRDNSDDCCCTLRASIVAWERPPLLEAEQDVIIPASPPSSRRWPTASDDAEIPWRNQKCSSEAIMGWPIKSRSMKSCGTQVARANELDPSCLCWLLSGKDRNQNDGWICQLLTGRPTCILLDGGDRPDGRTKPEKRRTQKQLSKVRKKKTKRIRWERRSLGSGAGSRWTVRTAISVFS